MPEQNDQSSIPNQSPNPSKWAAIIYGRTYSVDFRFIVTPDNFGQKQKNFLWNYVKYTTRSAEDLTRGQRWLFIRTPNRCVVGVTCMVRDLIDSSSQGLQDFTRDKMGRPLYAFVGYVSENATSLDIPAMDLKLFAEPYATFIPQKWQETYADIGIDQEGDQEGDQDLKSEYSKEFKPDELATDTLEQNQIDVNDLIPSNDEKIIFWNISKSKSIWFTAGQSNKPLFICFGNLKKQDLISSEFNNAVIEKVGSRKEENRILISEPKPIVPDSGQNSPRNRQNSPENYSSYQQHPNPRYYTSYQNNAENHENITNSLIDFAVNISSTGRSVVESFSEDLAMQIDDIFLSTFGKIFKPLVGNETIDEIHRRIAKLDEFEQRLKFTIEDYLNQRSFLDTEIEEIKNEIRYSQLSKTQLSEYKYKLNELSGDLHKINERLREAQEKLDKIQPVLLRLSNSLSTNKSNPNTSEQPDTKFLRDSNYGFKEKEQDSSESENNIWDL